VAPSMGLIDSGFVYRTFDETPREGMRLGRTMWLDGRSAAYMVENSVEQMGVSYRSVQWERVAPILDQGNLGSCTGNAGTGALGTQPFYDAVGQSVLPAGGDADQIEAFAVQLYSDASAIDAFPGTYPPDDTGSSGLAICKTLKRRGTIAGYRWARSAYGFIRLLQDGPVLQGMPWYNAFFEPDHDGFIDSDPTWEASGLAGGHEVEAVGVELDTQDVSQSVITYANSWSTAWGDEGRFRMRLATYDALHSVDLKQYVV
jgi:Papain family cysteine protease